jgi:Zn-dependent protease/CBS domain-containing protein
MDQSIRLAEVDEVPIFVHWSVVAIFALVAWELADLILPVERPHQSPGIYWLVGLAATGLFFLSLLAHELAHSIVAKRNAIAVKRITLWLFGGVSELESEALTPGAELRIAIVGPMVSLILGAVFGVLALSLHGAGGAPGVLLAALGWLAWMNLLLGGFNLIPAAPLDGGRVLQAVVWHRSGDRLRATSIAARSGRVFGYLLVAVGVVEFLAVGVVGLWFVLLGWFLLAAAGAEGAQATMRSLLGGVRVSQIMTRDPDTFPGTTSVENLLARQLHHHRFSSYPLRGPDGSLVGLVTLSTLRRVPASERASTTLADLSRPLSEVPLCTPEEQVVELLRRMQTSPDGRALVVDAHQRLVGIVSPSDVLWFLQGLTVERGRDHRSMARGTSVNRQR